MNVVGESLLLVDGELRPATGGGTFDNFNPATGQVAGTAPCTYPSTRSTCAAFTSGPIMVASSAGSPTVTTPNMPAMASRPSS